jgi:hypothetical protein
MALCLYCNIRYSKPEDHPFSHYQTKLDSLLKVKTGGPTK